jgi:hypothetical protein
MTSQLTPERTTPKKKDETHEPPIFLQPWFWMAMVCTVAMVLLVVFG